MPLFFLQAAQPFFTDDAMGVVKIFVTLVAPIIGVVLGGVWKIVHGPLQMEDVRLREYIEAVDKNLKNDLNALGAKVSDHHTRHEKHVVEYQLLAGKVNTVELEQRYIREAVAEFRSTVDEFRETSVDNKTVIVGEFSRQMELVRGEVREVREKMIELDARLDAREELKQLFQEMVKRA